MDYFHVMISSAIYFSIPNICFPFFFSILNFLSSSPGGIPARNSKGERLLLFLGVIDILQSYRLRKKVEHTFKSMVTDGVSGS